jgi:hypothetical protein
MGSTTRVLSLAPATTCSTAHCGLRPCTRCPRATGKLASISFLPTDTKHPSYVGRIRIFCRLKNRLTTRLLNGPDCKLHTGVLKRTVKYGKETAAALDRSSRSHSHFQISKSTSQSSVHGRICSLSNARTFFFGETDRGGLSLSLKKAKPGCFALKEELCSGVDMLVYFHKKDR